MDYAKAIRVARASRGITQKALAEDLKVSPSHISLIEANKRSPSLEMLENISASLKIPMHLLILLGAEEKDLNGLPSEHAEEMAKHLLKIITGI